MALTEAVDAWVPQDSFGARLALIRQRFGWNVSEAAQACGIANATWQKWERGASPRKIEEKARQIADRCGCDYVWLMVGGALRSRCCCVDPQVTPGNLACGVCAGLVLRAVPSTAGEQMELAWPSPGTYVRELALLP